MNNVGDTFTKHVELEMAITLLQKRTYAEDKGHVTAELGRGKSVREHQGG